MVLLSLQETDLEGRNVFSWHMHNFTWLVKLTVKVELTVGSREWVALI